MMEFGEAVERVCGDVGPVGLLLLLTLFPLMGVALHWSVWQQQYSRGKLKIYFI
jgi:hypothetical protein